jgi:type I restriction enzyme M protein
VEIDLTETHGKLVELEKTMAKAREKHNQFLEELGLPPLPGSSGKTRES